MYIKSQKIKDYILNDTGFYKIDNYYINDLYNSENTYYLMKKKVIINLPEKETIIFFNDIKKITSFDKAIYNLKFYDDLNYSICYETKLKILPNFYGFYKINRKTDNFYIHRLVNKNNNIDDKYKNLICLDNAFIAYYIKKINSMQTELIYLLFLDRNNSIHDFYASKSRNHIDMIVNNFK